MTIRKETQPSCLSVPALQALVSTTRQGEREGGRGRRRHQDLEVTVSTQMTKEQTEAAGFRSQHTQCLRDT